MLIACRQASAALREATTSGFFHRLSLIIKPSLDAPAVIAAFRVFLGQGVYVTLGQATGFVPSLFGLEIGFNLLRR